MPAFGRAGQYFPYSAASNGVQVVPISSIEPPTRSVGIGGFRKYKLVPILMALQSPECALPPVHVEPSSGEFAYRVTNGFHRYYASVAVGYAELPVVVSEPGANNSSKPTPLRGAA